MRVNRFVDDVHGIVIGRYYRHARVYYQDRPQGGTLFAETEDEVLAKAKARIAEYKAMPAGYLIYPDKTAWTVRLYNE